MRQAVTWWRSLGGLLAACVLALLVIAPTAGMAACLCADDAPIVSVEASAAAGSSVKADQKDHSAPCEAACCISGHCHHGGGMIDAVVVGLSAPAPAVSRQVMTAVHVLASRTISGPDRPPRA